MQADDELALLKHTIMQGWPKSIKQVPPEIQPFWTFREELTVEDGLILKGTRIVIPNKQHKAIMKLLHEGHLGLNKYKLRAKKVYTGQDWMTNWKILSWIVSYVWNILQLNAS